MPHTKFLYRAFLLWNTLYDLILNWVWLQHGDLDYLRVLVVLQVELTRQGNLWEDLNNIDLYWTYQKRQESSKQGTASTYHKLNLTCHSLSCMKISSCGFFVFWTWCSPFIPEYINFTCSIFAWPNFSWPDYYINFGEWQQRVTINEACNLHLALGSSCE